MTKLVSGTHAPLGRRRDEVIASLMRGITREQVISNRRAILRSRGAMIGILWLALGASIALNLDEGRGGTLLFEDHPFHFTIALIVPVFVLIEYLGVRPACP
jgi:hypothetical protein